MLKSEVEPTTQGALKVLVGSTFESVINDASKDVLVKFYATWCEHCRQIAPFFEELASSVSELPDLIIGKFDSTLNEVPGLLIRGYPTITLYTKDNKKGIDYLGEDLKPESIKKWLAENSSAYKTVYKAAEVADSKSFAEDL